MKTKSAFDISRSTSHSTLFDVDQKQVISDTFSAAAKDYGKFNQLQKESAGLLLAGTTEHSWNVERVLDIGAGPGTGFPRGQSEYLDGHDTLEPQVIALDIAQGMLKQLKINYPSYSAICADAQSLPVKDDMVDLIYSNLALQWCSDLGSALSEAHRVMRSGAELHCAVVADDSLSQLSSLGLKVNRFRTKSDIESMMELCPWQAFSVEIAELTVHFDDLRSLLYSIKGVGASVVTSNGCCSQGLRLRGRQDWLALQKRAEGLRNLEGLPLTYQVAIIRAKKG